MIRINMHGNGWNFILYEEDNKLRWQLFAGIVTEGTHSIDTLERDIIEKVIEAHYRPRALRSLKGEERTYPPLYDDPALYPEAFEAKKRLEGLILQRELL